MIERIKISNYRRIKQLDLSPHAGVNIIVGDNEAGKSTLLEAMLLAVSGRVNGRWAQEDLNPNWFNTESVDSFFNDLEKGSKPQLPTIDIEVYFGKNDPELQTLRGINNSESLDCPGLLLRVAPDGDYRDEIESYFSQPGLPRVLPTDLYSVEWREFSLTPRTRQPRGAGHAVINAGVVSGTSGIDYKMRQLVRDFVTPSESAMIALDHRKSKAEITRGVLKDVNDRINGHANSFGVGLQMDQSAASNWDASVTAHINNIPFAYLGHGRQVRTKVALAMSRDADLKKFIVLEEPENHLSHTSLMELIEQVQGLSSGRQVFVTTHSSFVLNRLGFKSLQLMHAGRTVPFSDKSISPDTVSYYQKQSGYDTLRLVLANKAVIVEGPSDEMIFNMAYEANYGKPPRADAIDVISMGTRGKRALELAAALGRKMAVLRDNDGKDPSHWTTAAAEYLLDGNREMFIGDPRLGGTLEPQFVAVNDSAALREIFGLDGEEDVEEYMLSNKTEAAWQLANSKLKFKYPEYINRAVSFINAC
ncbi:ATP-dependent nuclease [Arthrobacter luteolus]|uniref:ATP-dependent nuclease n=1 Tax=Arthrobacter luteolus TaxID=98672 RepID=UPI00384B0791